MQSAIEMDGAGAAPASRDAAYLVGRDRAGRWVAMEANGRGGGLFASREAAVCFAHSETSWRPGAVSFSAEPIAWR